MSAEPPVNGLDYFRDNTGEYFWNKDKNAYAVHTPNKDGSTSFSGEYYKADEFSEPVGNYTIIFDLSNSKPKDEFDASKTITAFSEPIMAYLEKMGDVKDISNPDKYPGVKIYSSPDMNGALTAGNIIFTNPGMERPNDLDHEYGHYLDFKHHFKYDKTDYAKTIAGPSFISATMSTIAPKYFEHEKSQSELRANRLGGAWGDNNALKTKFKK
jgi:hypothetical protein